MNYATRRQLSLNRWVDEKAKMINPKYNNKNIKDSILDFIASTDVVISFGHAHPDQKRLESVLNTFDKNLWAEIADKFIDFQKIMKLICTKGNESLNNILLPMKHTGVESLWSNLYSDDLRVSKFTLLEGPEREVKCRNDVAMLAEIYSVVRDFVNK